MRELRSHLLSAFLKVPAEFAVYEGPAFVALLRRAVEAASLTAIGDVSVALEPYGVSAVVLLKESHVAIHYWPEYAMMSVDIHVCDYFGDNLARAYALAEQLSFTAVFPENKDAWKYQLAVSQPCEQGIPAGFS